MVLNLLEIVYDENKNAGSYPEKTILTVSFVLLFLLVILIPIIVLLVKKHKNHSSNSGMPANSSTRVRPKWWHTLLKVILIFVLLVALFFGIFKVVSCITTPNNTDKDLNPLNRLARNSDISVTEDSDFSLSYAFTVVALNDISDLEVTFEFADSNHKILVSKIEKIGNVRTNQSYGIEFSFGDFSISQLSKIKTWHYEVTGGTVSFI